MRASSNSAAWRSAPLSEFIHEDRIIVESKSERARNLRYLSLEQVESNTGRILPLGNLPFEQGTSTTFAFSRSHILYGKLRPYLNKVALPNFEGRCTTEMIPLRPREGVDREFIAWHLRRPETVQWAMSEKTGSRMPRADMSNLLEMPVSVPPLEEQRRIAAILNEQMAVADSTRVQVAQQLNSAELIATSVLCAVFESEVANTWPRRAIGDIAKTASGATPPRGTSAYFTGGTIPWIKTGELKDNLIAKAEEHVTDLALRDCSLPLLSEGTLLIAMYGQGQTRGRTGLLAIPATTNQACFAILPNPSEFEPRFLQYWFRHSYQRLRRETEGRGGNQPNLNGILLRGLEVPLPALGEQRDIAAQLDLKFRLASEISGCGNQAASAIESLPAAFLRRAFFGHA